MVQSQKFLQDVGTDMHAALFHDDHPLFYYPEEASEVYRRERTSSALELKRDPTVYFQYLAHHRCVEKT